MGRYEYIFLYFLRYTCHEIVFILEDEDASAVIFMKRNDGWASDEDSANENDGWKTKYVQLHCLLLSSKLKFHCVVFPMNEVELETKHVRNVQHRSVVERIERLLQPNKKVDSYLIFGRVEPKTLKIDIDTFSA